MKKQVKPILGVLALVIASLGLIGGASSYARGENRAFAVSAGTIGAVALAWKALMVGLGVTLLIVIFSMLWD